MPDSHRTVSALAPADRPIVETLIRKRIERVLPPLLALEADADTVADVVDGTLGQYPDDPIAMAIVLRLDNADRLALIVGIVAEWGIE